MLRDHFKKKTASTAPGHGEVPDGMFRKCERCGKILYEEDVAAHHFCCPQCGSCFRVDPETRIRMVADRGTFEEWDHDLKTGNPLEFPGYEEKLEQLRQQTGRTEAVTTGCARIRGIRTALGVMASDFLMGSMGSVVGERITRMIERATAQKLPVVLFCCSGGARMQEGIVSLMQMAKTAQALKRHHEQGLLYLPVLTDPTMGGVTASFAMLGDVILAEPGAMIGFAGARVIRQTIGGKLPEGFQSAEFLQSHGFVDRIVPREQMRKTLAVLLDSCANKKKDAPGVKQTQAGGANGSASQVQIQSAGANGSATQAQIQDAGAKADADAKAYADTIQNQGLSAAKIHIRGEKKNVSAWERVQAARSEDRPHASDYIALLFDGFMELRGDRLYGDDRAVIGGIASFAGRYVMVIGQQKGRSRKENRHRNFGMMSPEGYRKALRLMKLAEKFGLPVILFVDTPGAFCGVEAEERGQGEAIARNLFEMAGLRVPILSVVIGEGGSGGALALALANEVWMLENAVYSVLSPEGFAAILWKDSARMEEAAECMRLTAFDLLQLGVIDDVVEEGDAADFHTMEELSKRMKAKLQSFLEEYVQKDEEELIRQRYGRFRNIRSYDQ